MSVEWKRLESVAGQADRWTAIVTLPDGRQWGTYMAVGPDSYATLDVDAILMAEAEHHLAR